MKGLSQPIQAAVPRPASTTHLAESSWQKDCHGYAGWQGGWRSCTVRPDGQWTCILQCWSVHHRCLLILSLPLPKKKEKRKYRLLITWTLGSIQTWIQNADYIRGCQTCGDPLLEQPSAQLLLIQPYLMSCMTYLLTPLQAIHKLISSLACILRNQITSVLLW